MAGGRLGAVLSVPRDSGPVLLGPEGPWLATSLADARRVLTEPGSFDFPGHVGRGSDLSGSASETRSGHHVFAATTPGDVARGMAVFTAEWSRALDAETADDRGAHDAMQVLRLPVARATCAAVLPAVSEGDRSRVADLALTWIDALGPVIAAPRPPRRWSATRRCELRASIALEEALSALETGPDTPQVVATMLAAGIQVPIAAGAWLLVWLASDAVRTRDPDRAVWEALRLTPPTWVTARVASQDVRLGEADITAGSLVLVSPLLLGRLSDLVPDPQDDMAAFDPDRWATDRVRPGAWLPFGAGPHACPGRTLGLAMLRHLALWAAGHELRLAEPVAIDQSRGIAPRPASIVLTGGGALS